MTIEEKLSNLLFGIKKNINILRLNLQSDTHVISLNCSKVNAERSVDLLDESEKTYIIKSNITNLPFSDYSFNMLILKGIITNSNALKKDQKAIFKNIFRILKPNGIFFLEYRKQKKFYY